jgi:hypothetical protein
MITNEQIMDAITGVQILEIGIMFMLAVVITKVGKRK